MRTALDTAEDKRTPDQQQLAYNAQQQITVSHNEVAKTVKGADRIRAFQLADKLEAEAKLLNYINIYRGIVNFDYWRQRCKAEREPRMLAARQAVFDADRQLELGQNFAEVQKLYENSWQAFAEIFADYPDLMANPETEELVESVERYRDLLAQLDKPFPSDFILNSMLEKHRRGKKLLETTKLVNEAAAELTKPNEKKPEEKQPEEAKPDSTKPTENKPETKKTEEKPAEEKKSADDKPAEKKASETKPDSKKSDDNQDQPTTKKADK